MREILNMNAIATRYASLHRTLCGRLRHRDGLPPLLMHRYLAPVMIATGLHKFRNREDMMAWFGDPGCARSNLGNLGTAPADRRRSPAVLQSRLFFRRPRALFIGVHGYFQHH